MFGTYYTPYYIIVDRLPEPSVKRQAIGHDGIVKAGTMLSRCYSAASVAEYDTYGRPVAYYVYRD